MLNRPDLIGSSAQDQDAEDKERGEPDLADHRGVGLHFIQQACQHIPFAHFSRQLSCFLCIKGTAQTKIKINIFLLTCNAFYPSGFFCCELQSYGDISLLSYIMELGGRIQLLKMIHRCSC